VSLVPEPEVGGTRSLIVRFFKDGNKDIISITAAGDAGQEFHGKVTPKHIARFPKEWDAYQGGFDMPKVVGTPLTEIPGFNPELERIYRVQGVAVCEQLAEASDAVLQKLGMGSQQFRKLAKMVVENKKAQASAADVNDMIAKAVSQALDAEKVKQQAEAADAKVKIARAK
jgi:hypothetical protein